MNRKAIVARLIIVVAVTAGIFYVSAGHIIDVAVAHGNPFRTAIVYPFAADGLIIASALTMSAKVAVSRSARHIAKLARYFGFAATLYANAAHSGWGSFDAIAVNVFPAIALILMMELVISSVQLTPASRRAVRTPAAGKSSRKLHAV